MIEEEQQSKYRGDWNSDCAEFRDWVIAVYWSIYIAIIYNATRFCTNPDITLLKIAA